MIMNIIPKVQNFIVEYSFKDARCSSTLKTFVTASCLILGFGLAVSNSKAMAFSAGDDLFRTYGASSIKGLEFDHREGGGSAESCDAGSCNVDIISVGQLNDRQWGPYAGIKDFGNVAKKWSFLLGFWG